MDKNGTLTNHLKERAITYFMQFVAKKINANIGETKRMLYSQVAEHCGYVTNMMTDKSTGDHFNSPGHSLSDMEVTVLEQNKGKGAEYRKEREHYFTRKFYTNYRGLHKQK